jgi:putative ABC transport system permease protein
MHDLKFAQRFFSRTPGTSALIVITLGVAIATATIIASTVDMVWHFLPANRTERMVFVASTDPRPERSQAGVSGGLARTGVSIPDLVDYSTRAQSFEALAAFTFQNAVLTGLDVPSRISTIRTTSNLLDVWGITPQLGRTFTDADATPGGERVAIITDAFWQRQFSRTHDTLGKSISIDGQPHTIVGVLPQSTSTGMFRSIDVALPIVLDRERNPRDDRRLYVTGALKPGVAIEQADAELAAISRQLQIDYPITNANTGAVVRPLLELLGGNINAAVYLLVVIAGIIVCIACANVSSIILARAGTRRRELAVRAALGAGRVTQIRQIMIEGLLTSAAGGAAGIVLAWWGIAAVRYASPDTDGFAQMTLNGRVFIAAAALTLLAPVGFAFLPALRMSRPDMDELRQGNRGAESTKGRRLRQALVVVQVALALIMMTQVGLLSRTTWRLHHLEKGLDPAQVLTLRMTLAEADYRDAAEADAFYTRALDRIQSLPGVTSAGTVTALPFADRDVSVHFVIEGVPVPSPKLRPETARAGISTGYIQTMRIPLVRGRGFTRADFGDVPPVALISRETARRYWPAGDPIGRRIAFDGDEREWVEIVGIVGDVRHSNAGTAPEPKVYVPSSWRPQRSTVFVVRGTAADPTQLAPSIRSALAQLDKTQPVYDVRSMHRVLAEDLSSTYLFTGMLGVFAIVALLLAAAGVYGLVSFSVNQRTREIGLRMALGARPAAILGMVVATAGLPMLLGIAIGAAGAAALLSITSAVLSDVDVRDPVAYILVIVPLLVVALAATYIPARRATRVDPLLALRAD